MGFLKPKGKISNRWCCHYPYQTPTKVLEYCAVGLPVLSNDYAWVRYFTTHYQGNFYILRNDPSTWPSSFGPALDAYPYVIPDVSSLTWPRILLLTSSKRRRAAAKASRTATYTSSWAGFLGP